MKASASRSALSPFSSKDWRQHSLAKPAERVSGTQICTGRRPDLRSFAR